MDVTGRAKGEGDAVEGDGASPSGSPLLARLLGAERLLARALAAAAAAIGLAVIAGWALGLPAAHGALAAVKPNSAVVVVACGAAVLLLARRRPSPAARRAAAVLAAAAAAIGAVTLAEHALGAPHGIDELLFRDPLPVPGGAPGRMGPLCALFALLAGVALLAHDVETRSGTRPSQLLALATLALPVQAVVGHSYGIPPLYAHGCSVHAGAAASVAAALLCGAVLFLHPDRGFVRVLASAGPPGFFARRILLAVLVGPPLVGWVLVVALGGVADGAVAAALVVVATMGMGVAVVWWTAARLEPIDAARRSAEETTRAQREWLRAVLAAIGDAVVAIDREGRVALVNPAAERLVGTREAEALGRPARDVVRGATAAAGDALADALREGAGRATPVALELDVAGATLPVEGVAAPIPAGGGAEGVVLALRDTSARRVAEGERARLLAAERAARGDAERASRAKDEFIATVSHELRTPLNAVLGWARLLRIGKLDAAATARAVEAIERSATTQAQIVDDLLDVSRIVRGELRLDLRTVDLGPVVEAAIDTVRPAATAREIEIASVLAPAAGPVVGDPGRLQQVVWNLLSNAVKFTPAGGRVEVRLEPVEGAVELRVRDTGAGIDPEFLPHVFERFRQQDASSTRRHGGLGLGLAIVRHLVEAHGGTVSAESGGAGLGSAFAVRLPVARGRTRHVPSPGRPALEAGIDDRPLASLAALRVLVVDDDADTLEVVRQVLEQAGARVTAVRSARDALAAMAGSRPDVLLSDIAMPGEDGYALIRQVRALAAERGGDVPAAALTAYTQADDRRQALSAGYQLWLAKPIEPAELTEALARLARRA